LAVKTCSKCKKELSADYFHRFCHSSDGLSAWCKSCKKQYHKEWESKNREKCNLYRKEWLKNNKNYYKLYFRKWSSQNRNKTREWARIYRENHSYECRERIKLWGLNNPDKLYKYDLRRRSRKKNAFVEDVDRFIVLENYNQLCGICGGPVNSNNFHVDHIIPISKGGEHSYKNTQPAHLKCNLVKGDKIVA